MFYNLFFSTASPACRHGAARGQQPIEPGLRADQPITDVHAEHRGGPGAVRGPGQLRTQPENADSPAPDLQQPFVVFLCQKSC